MPHAPNHTSNINRRDRTSSPVVDLGIGKIKKFKPKTKKRMTSKTRKFRPF